MKKKNELPSQLYDTSTTPRLSEASMFDNPPSNGTVRQEPFPWRTTLVGVVLLIIGVFFLLTALLHFRKYDNDTDVAFIVLGSIAFLPGCYAIFSIFQWYRGVPGFHLSDCTCDSFSSSYILCVMSIVD